MRAPHIAARRRLSRPYRRFLRARKFDPARAYTQFADFQAWRKKHGVEELYKGFDTDELESARRFYTTWTGRRSKVCASRMYPTSQLILVQIGLPVYVYRPASLAGPLTKELQAVPSERRYQRM